MLSLLKRHPRTVFQSTCSAPVPPQLLTSALYLRHTALLTGLAVEWVFFSAHLFAGLCLPLAWKGCSENAPWALHSRQHPLHRLPCVLGVLFCPWGSGLSAKTYCPGHSPLLESWHVSWALSSTGDAMGYGLRLEYSCRSLSILDWALNCSCWPPDADVLHCAYLSFFLFNCTIIFMYLMLLNWAIDEES